MSASLPAPAQRVGVTLDLGWLPDPRLLATLNRFHFRRVFLAVDDSAASLANEAGTTKSGLLDVALVSEQLRSLWACYVPYLEGEGWLPNKSLAQGGQGKNPRADKLAQELEAGLCRGLGIEPPAASGSFGLAFTHDVDVVGSCPLATLKSGLVFAMNALRGMGDPEAAWFFLRLAARFLSGRVDYYGFSSILALARQMGFRPVFFIYARLPGHNQLNRWQRLAGLNPNYDLEWPELTNALADMRASGAQAGLHGSFLSAQETQLLREEKSRLEQASGQPCRASRQHFLHLRREATLAAAHACGMTVDSTCGYVYDNGLFCGTVRPFYAVAPAGDDPGLVVVPMAFMDAVPLYFRPASPARVRQELKELVELVRAWGGCVAVNFHQRMISCLPEYHRLYRDLLEMTRAAGGSPVAMDDLESLYPTLDRIRPLPNR